MALQTTGFKLHVAVSHPTTSTHNYVMFSNPTPTFQKLNFKETSLSSKANGHSAYQGISCLLQKQKINHRVHKWVPPAPILNQMDRSNSYLTSQNDSPMYTQAKDHIRIS
jgi:hypothetical protein